MGTACEDVGAIFPDGRSDTVSAWPWSGVKSLPGTGLGCLGLGPRQVTAATAADGLHGFRGFENQLRARGPLYP